MARILVISPAPTHPPGAGNRARILAMMEFFRSEGHELHFLHVARDPADPAAMKKFWGNRYYSVPFRWPKRPPDQRVILGSPSDARFEEQSLIDRLANGAYWLRRLCRAALQSEWPSKWNWALDEWYTPAADAEIRRLHAAHRFDVVLVEYVYFSRALKLFDDGVLKLIDSHDVFSNRYKQYLDNNEIPVYFSMSAKDEARALDRADVVIAIQPHEEEYFRKITKSKVLTIGHLVHVRRGAAAAKARNVLFVGSPTTVNVNAVAYFTDEVLPIIRSKYPDVKFIVAGKICQKVPNRREYVKLGEMPDLTPAYDIADIVVNPRRFGSGLSIKSIEALSFGKPLVATPSGCSGMEDGANKAFVLAHTPDELAAGVVRLLDEPATYRAYSEAGREYALRHNSTVAEALRTVLASTPEPRAR